jgi:hypothetical protein
MAQSGPSQLEQSSVAFIVMVSFSHPHYWSPGHVQKQMALACAEVFRRNVGCRWGSVAVGALVAATEQRPEDLWFDRIH